MDPVLTGLLILAVLPMGIASIHVAEKLRWYEPPSKLWKIGIAADCTFLAACILLTFYREDSFTFGTFFKTVLQMLFITGLLASLTYLLHSGVWALTRLGQNVHLDELFSRLIVFAIFASLAFAAYFALVLLFDF